VPHSDFILRDGEELVLDLHPHWWYFASSVAATVLTIALGVAALRTDIDLLKFVAALGIVCSLVWLAERAIRWVSTHFILTSDRIVWREGIVAKHGVEFPLQRIQTIFFSQRIFERLLGVGDLKIESASETGTEVFEDIKSPAKVQHEIYSQMELNENRGMTKLGETITAAQQFSAGAAAPEAHQTIAEQIADLHRLHEQGALTDDEFEIKKAELLDRM